MTNGSHSNAPDPAHAGSGQPADTDPSNEPTRTAGITVEAPALTGAWGELRIIEEIGRGAYGRVYRAWDEALAREVALKVIRIDSSNPGAAATVSVLFALKPAPLGQLTSRPDRYSLRPHLEERIYASSSHTVVRRARLDARGY